MKNNLLFQRCFSEIPKFFFDPYKMFVCLFVCFQKQQQQKKKTKNVEIWSDHKKERKENGFSYSSENIEKRSLKICEMSFKTLSSKKGGKSETAEVDGDWFSVLTKIAFASNDVMISSAIVWGIGCLFWIHTLMAPWMPFKAERTKALSRSQKENQQQKTKNKKQNKIKLK